MDRHWIETAQKTGRRVGVVMGQIAAEVNPLENAPMVVPGTVVEESLENDRWWVDVEVIPGQTMPQMYRAEEILGFWPHEQRHLASTI